MRLKFEIELPNTLDMVLNQEDYEREAVKIALQIKACIRPQLSPDQDKPLSRQFLGDAFLLGMGLEVTGKMLKGLATSFAEKGDWEP